MCAQRTGAHRARPPSGLSCAASPRHRGPPISAASCRRSNGNGSPVHSLNAVNCCCVVQGCTDSCTTGAVRGAEHRRGRRKQPAGARARCARVGCEHTDVLSDDPAVPEKHRAVRFARCESDHRVRCLAFWLLLGTAPQERREQRSWPRSGGGQDARSHAKSNRLARRARRSSALKQSKSEDAGFRVPPAAAPE